MIRRTAGTLAVLTVLVCLCLQETPVCADVTMRASDITTEAFVKAVAGVVDTARRKNYKYGDSRSAVPTADGIISCDRMVAKALWDLGFTDQNVGGITVGNMSDYLISHGFIETTSFDSIQYGSIVLVRHYGYNYYTHTFVALSFDPDTRTGEKYDCGAKSLIDSVQPIHIGSWHYTDDIRVYRIPESRIPQQQVVKVEIPAYQVKLDTVDACMVTGQALNLKATVLPKDCTDPSLTWTSTNPKVATVNRWGVVKTVSPGTARIRVTASGGKVKAYCKVTVLKTKVTSIRLNKKKLKLRKGRSALLKARCYPSSATDKAVVWKSSKPGVVSVNAKGVVKAKKKGTAVITARLRSGKIKASCKVTVK